MPEQDWRDGITWDANGSRIMPKNHVEREGCVCVVCCLDRDWEEKWNNPRPAGPDSFPEPDSYSMTDGTFGA